MTRNDTSARRDDGRTRRDLHEEVTQTIIDALERGVVPWRSPILGRGKAGHPTNLESDRPYAGVNVFLLALAGWSAGYGSRYWLTFKQALARGGSVRKGERSTLVVFWKLYETKDRETGESATVPVLKHYHVFNAEQCDGITTPDTADLISTEFHPIDAAQAIANGYVGGPSVTHAGSRAFYRPSTDAVVLPEAQRGSPPARSTTRPSSTSSPTRPGTRRDSTGSSTPTSAPSAPPTTRRRNSSPRWPRPSSPPKRASVPP
jgi:antirestriction protein ArdC